MVLTRNVGGNHRTSSSVPSTRCRRRDEFRKILDSTGDGETVSKDSLFPPKGKDIRNWREVNLAKKILATIIGGKIN